MVRTASSMTLALGTAAPDFCLPSTTGHAVRLSDCAGQVLVVMFICNHCPFVQLLRRALVDFARDYRRQNAAIVAINSNDAAAYPQDDSAAMVREVQTQGYTFAYLSDQTQSVARAYKAACTPDFFVFDTAHKLVYRGQFDDARPQGPAPVDGHSLREAVDRALAHQAPMSEQKPSLGCSIKWKL